MEARAARTVMNPRNLMCIYYVHDMDRALAIYRDALGLRSTEESPGWSSLACGDAVLALHKIFEGQGEGTVAHAWLNLEVDELEPAVERVKAAGGKLKVLREAGGGVPVRLAELEDAEGNGFELRQFVG